MKLTLTTLSLTISLAALTQAAPTKPNIIVILADDMGVDSVAELNDKCGIATPHLDTMVKSGISFSDAHSGSAVCTPTRYGLLTGRYSWRSRLKRGIVAQWERPLIEENRLTLPGMLRKEGYSTACIGKWHLGWNWPKKGGGFTNKLKEIDFSQKIQGGPTSRGFDLYFGDDVPNWQPFVWIKNGKTQGIPDTHLKFAAHYYSGAGIGVKGWKLDTVLPRITQESVDYINAHAKDDKPFFLYFAMTSPHTPIAPSKRFRGKSGISPYADLLMETDWSVGQINLALKKNGIEKNTLVIFTTDNGTSPKANFPQLRKHNAELQNHWRGTKADGWEGGHRVPFIANWPGVITPNSKSDQLISLVDIMATCASVVGHKLPATAAEDSHNLLPVFKDASITKPIHEGIVCHSISGVFIIRQGEWKLQFSSGSGGWSQPKDAIATKKGLPKWQLYNLKTDPKETTNLLEKYPKRVAAMTQLLREYVENGRSTAGKPQPNHNNAKWWRGLPWAK
ncbi:MAG: sulfatase family protein [Akkermansiaceae bacterium]